MRSATRSSYGDLASNTAASSVLALSKQGARLLLPFSLALCRLSDLDQRQDFRNRLEPIPMLSCILDRP